MTSLPTTFKQNLDMETSNTTPNQLSMAFSDNEHSVWNSGFCKKCSNVKNAVHQMKKLDCFLSFKLQTLTALSFTSGNQGSVLINLMPFPSQNFKSTVSDECPLYSLSFSEADRSSPMSLCNEDCGGFSLLYWKLDKQKMKLKTHHRLLLALENILNNLKFNAETPIEACCTTFVLQLQTKHVSHF